MIRDQNTLKSSLSQAIIIKRHFKKGCKRAKNGMQNSLKIRIKNQTTYFNGFERAEPFLLYRAAGGHNNSLIINLSRKTKQRTLIKKSPRCL